MSADKESLRYLSGPNCYGLMLAGNFAPFYVEGDTLIVNPDAPIEVGKPAILSLKGLGSKRCLVRISMVPSSGISVPTGGDAMPCLGFQTKGDTRQTGDYQIPVDRIESCHRVVGVSREV
jgi:hypothetical protein